MHGALPYVVYTNTGMCRIRCAFLAIFVVVIFGGLLLFRAGFSQQLNDGYNQLIIHVCFFAQLYAT